MFLIDSKLLFNLKVLGSLHKNDKLTKKGELLSVDDRWFLQGVRRWFSDDSRFRSSNHIIIILNEVTHRVDALLNDDFTDKNNLEEDLKNISLEKKQFREKYEQRKRLIRQYSILLTNAKSGLENCRDTYEDNFTKNSFNLCIQKVDNILERLRTYE